MLALGLSSKRDLIDQLRAGGVILTCDPDTHTIRSDGNSTIAVTTGQNH